MMQLLFINQKNCLSAVHICLFLSQSVSAPSWDTNSPTDTFAIFTSCLDNFCPLSSRPADATPSSPWLSDVLLEHCSNLRMQRGSGANRKILTLVFFNPSSLHSLLIEHHSPAHSRCWK